MNKNIDLSELNFIEGSAEMNRKVSEMGHCGDYGLNIGRTIDKMGKEGVIKEDVVNLDGCRISQ